MALESRYQSFSASFLFAPHNLPSILILLFFSALPDVADFQPWFPAMISMDTCWPHAWMDFWHDLPSLNGLQYTAWYGNCIAREKASLKRVVWSAERTMGCQLPTLRELYNKRCVWKAQRITKDRHLPSHKFFQPLKWQGKGSYHSHKCGMTRFWNSLYQVLSDCWTGNKLRFHGLLDSPCLSPNEHASGLYDSSVTEPDNPYGLFHTDIGLP